MLIESNILGKVLFGFFVELCLLNCILVCGYGFCLKNFIGLAVLYIEVFLKVSC